MCRKSCSVPVLVLVLSLVCSPATQAGEGPPLPDLVEADTSNLAMPAIVTGQLRRWKDLVASGKGMMVAKLRQGGATQIVVFPGANYSLSGLRLGDDSYLCFESVDQFCEYQRSIGAGVLYSDGSGLLSAEPGHEALFSEEERRMLRLDDPLGDERDLDALKKARAGKVGDPAFDWIRSGTLYHVRDSGYQYRAADGRFASVFGDPRKVAAMICEEIHDARKMDSFVRNQLPEVLFRLLGDSDVSAAVLTRSYIDRRLADVRERGDRVRDSAKDNELLERFVSGEPLVMVDGLWWRLAMYVLNADGSVERWDAEGSVSHFNIATIRRTEELPAGSIGNVIVRR